MAIYLKAFKPKTLDEAVDYLYESLTEEDKQNLKDPQVLAFMHHGPMMAVRNEWGLWSGSDLKTFFMEAYGLGHADDMSGLIQDSLLAKVNGTVFDAEVQAAWYREYWRKLNIDPLTQEEM